MNDTDAATERTVNIPLLRKAVEWAEAEAAKPDQKQSAWYQDVTVTDGSLIGRECGSCYCIAGYVAMLETGNEDPGEEVAVVDFAMDRLGINSLSLFYYDNTIEDVRRIAEDLAGERL